MTVCNRKPEGYSEENSSASTEEKTPKDLSLKVFYILATGPSINDISDEQWDFLNSKTTIGVTLFVKHPFVPTHHYTHEYHGPSSELLRERYENTDHMPHLLIGNNILKRFSWAPDKTMVRPGETFDAFAGKKWSLEDGAPPEEFDTVWARSFSEELFSFRGSLMSAINSAFILGADKVVLCGVDLLDNKHFYKDEVRSPFHDRIRKENNTWDEDSEQHSTTTEFHGGKGIVDGIKWVSKYKKIVCANKDSLLVRDGILEHEDIPSSKIDYDSDGIEDYTRTKVSVVCNGSSLNLLSKDEVNEINSTRLFRANYYWHGESGIKKNTEAIFFGDGPEANDMYDAYQRECLPAHYEFSNTQGVDEKANGFNHWDLMKKRSSVFEQCLRDREVGEPLPTTGAIMFCFACSLQPKELYVCGMDFYTLEDDGKYTTYDHESKTCGYSDKSPHDAATDIKYIVEGCRLIGGNRIKVFKSEVLQIIVDYVFSNLHLEDEVLAENSYRIWKTYKAKTKTAFIFYATRDFAAGLDRLLSSMDRHNGFSSWDVGKFLISPDHERPDLLHMDSELDESSMPDCKNNPRFKNTFNKLSIFKMKDYDRVVFIDSDMVCLGDISRLVEDSLNDRDIYAVPDDYTVEYERRYKDGHKRINSGLMVINKRILSDSVFSEMVQMGIDGESYDGGDQGIINEYIYKHDIDVGYLDITYNMLKRVYYVGNWMRDEERESLTRAVEDRGTWKDNKSNLKLLHIVGTKPWIDLEPGYEEIDRMWRQSVLSDNAINIINDSLKLMGGRSRPDKSYPMINPILDSIPGCSITDVGCGRGTFGRLIRADFGEKFILNGVEVHKDYTDGIGENYNSVKIADFTKTYRKNKSDLYLFVDVLEHFDHKTALKIIKHLQSTGKMVIVSLPIDDTYWHQAEAFEKDNPHEAHLHNWTVEEAIETLGLRLVGVDTGIGVFTNVQ